jgi:hypothetical protein
MRSGQRASVAAQSGWHYPARLVEICGLCVAGDAVARDWVSLLAVPVRRELVGLESVSDVEKSNESPVRGSSSISPFLRDVSHAIALAETRCEHPSATKCCDRGVPCLEIGFATTRTIHEGRQVMASHREPTFSGAAERAVGREKRSGHEA